MHNIMNTVADMIEENLKAFACASQVEGEWVYTADLAFYERQMRIAGVLRLYAETLPADSTDGDGLLRCYTAVDMADQAADAFRAARAPLLDLLRRCRSCVDYQMGMQITHSEAGKKHIDRFQALLGEINAALAEASE